MIGSKINAFNSLLRVDPLLREPFSADWGRLLVLVLGRAATMMLEYSSSSSSSSPVSFSDAGFVNVDSCPVFFLNRAAIPPTSLITSFPGCSSVFVEFSMPGLIVAPFLAGLFFGFVAVSAGFSVSDLASRSPRIRFK